MHKRKRRDSDGGSLYPRAGWWVLRYREVVNEDGEIKTVQRAKRIAPADADHKTRASVRNDERLQAEIEEILKPAKKQTIPPARVMRMGQFVDDVYLPYVDANLRPSTAKGYRQMWDDYVKPQCEGAWLREVKPLHIHEWLQTIARLHELSETTLSHVKHLLGGIFAFASTGGYYDGVILFVM